MTMLIELAREDLGAHEEPPGSNITRFGQELSFTPAAWCMQWVSHVLRRAGMDMPREAQHTRMGWSSVGFFLNWARSAGWVVGEPQPGDLVCFDWDGNHYWPDHIGLIEDLLENGALLTIEGNALHGVLAPVDGAGDQVGQHVRARNNEIMAFIRPRLAGVPEVIPASFRPLPGPAVARNITPYPKLTRGVLLRRGTHGSDHVALWQQRMKQRGWRISVDGDYGPQTEGVCRKFQTEKHLEIDGIVGPKSWAAAWELPIT